MSTILRINSSMRTEQSQTRQLVDEVVEALDDGDSRVLTRDLAADPVPYITEDWIAANFTPEEERSDVQRDILALSDRLIGELEAADTLVIGVPVYNFGVPAALKAWVDQIARVRRTFRYTEAGPVGLLKGKKAYLVVASGGTKAGSDIDFAATYMRHMLGFIGIDDVTIIAADQLSMKMEESLAGARREIAVLADAPRQSESV